jgi:glycosyltransferase involved in cell wall biosynthesis
MKFNEISFTPDTLDGCSDGAGPNDAEPVIEQSFFSRVHPLPPETRLAFVSKPPPMDPFIVPLVEKFSSICQVRKVPVTKQAQIDEIMNWADLCWFEWCDELLWYASQKATRRCKIICRLHRFEAFTPLPRKVVWENVDLLIAACNNYVLSALKMKAPHLDSRVKVVQLLNGIDVDRFHYVEKEKGFNLACLGYLNMRKNPMFLLHCFHSLYQRDDRYRLFFGGKFQDDMMEQYVHYTVDRLGLSQAVFFDGWQKDQPAWLADKHYIVSASIGEGHPFGLLEAMAMGLKPAIHNFPGSEDFYPRHYIYNTQEEFCRIIMEDDYNTKGPREFVVRNHSLTDHIYKLEIILSDLLGENYLLKNFRGNERDQSQDMYSQLP